MKATLKLKWHLGLYILFSLLSIAIGQFCDSLSYRIGVQVNCEHPVTKESINCKSEKVPVGTVAYYKCDDYYVNQDGDNSGGNIRCNEKGKWIPRNGLHGFSCQMDCGKPGNITKWPWHAAIFYRNSGQNSFKYACGGTLLNPFNKGLAILTVANCFPENNKPEPSNIKVALGLTSTDFNRNTESKYAQTYSVRVMSTNTRSDLTLLQLEEEVYLSETVLPACLSTNPVLETQSLNEGDLAQFIGFGQSNQEATLHAENLILRPCLKSTPKRNVNFCAASSVKGICVGDFGGGLFSGQTIKDFKRYYVQGVLKDLEPDVVKDCSSSGVFIKLLNFTNWIKESVEKFSDDDDGVHSAEEIQKPGQVSLHHEVVTIRSPQENGHSLAVSQRPYPRPQQLATPVIPAAKFPEIQRVTTTTEITLVNPTDFQQTGLEWHNFYRRKHGVNEVGLSPKLNKESQYEAEQWTQNHRFKFQGITNWFASNGADLNSDDATKESIQDWYKTYGSYNFSDPHFLPFTHIIWKSTTHIGIGVARKGPEQIVVVKYLRPPYYENQKQQAFKENVLRPIS